MMRNVKKFLDSYGELLDLNLVGGEEGLDRKIYAPEIQRPGLSLAGYLKSYAKKRMLVFGKVEIEYLAYLSKSIRVSRLKAILNEKTPAVIVARRYRPPKELYELCVEYKIPLFRTKMTTMNLISQLTLLLLNEFAPCMTYHGSLVEVFGMGILIQGDSSVGKSEAALGLIERGHRLISDDLVKVQLKEGKYLEGFGDDLTRHHMEIRGIGIINVANLYGTVCVREKKKLDVVVNLEEWNTDHFYDRVGLEENTVSILNIEIPYTVLPVKPGRDIVLLLETIALNHRLKMRGYHSAKAFSTKLHEAIAQKEKK